MIRNTKRIMITGAAGQIGSELALVLRERHGADTVLATDIVRPPDKVLGAGPFESLNVTERADVERIVRKHDIDTIFHLAAILSANGEKAPQKAWDVNINGLYNVLETARRLGSVRIFTPSSIAVFGPATPGSARPRTPSSTRRPCTASPRSPARTSATTTSKNTALMSGAVVSPGSSAMRRFRAAAPPTMP